MEHVTSDEKMERVITSEERERLQRALFCVGLVDMTLELAHHTPEYEDEQWLGYN